MKLPLPKRVEPLKPVVADLLASGSTRVAPVGGCVRDQLLGIDSKDIDVEVFGLDFEEVKAVLLRHGRVDEVGVSFAVLKFHYAGEVYDFSLPRTESKVTPGHKGFAVEANKNLSYTEASMRRDYTINSMGIDFVTGELLDPHGGYKDLLNRQLRATSDKFSEDPLRVLRGGQFAGRFDLKVESKTAELCRSLKDEYYSLSRDRILGEWIKWAVRSVKPSAGLRFLIDTGWSELYPEFHNNIGVKQNPKYHGEIFVELHTQLVCDSAADIATRENLSVDDRLVLVMSAFLHDCAKYKTSVGEFPDIRSPMHAELGGPMSRVFLENIGMPEWIIKRVEKLVKNHMRHYNCSTDKAVRKLAVDLEPSNIGELCLLIESDYRGRGTTSSNLPLKAKNMLDISKKEKISGGKPKRILEGKHLQELGIPTGPLYGKIIQEAYLKQLDGHFNEINGAVQWLKDSKLVIL